MATWFIRPTKSGTYRVSYRSSPRGAVQVFHETKATGAHELVKWVVRKGELAAGDVIDLPEGGVLVCAISKANA